MQGTGSGSTENHVLGSASGYGTWVLHSATGLPLVPPASCRSGLAR